MNDILDQIKIDVDKIEISNSTLEKWQQLLDMLLELSEAKDAIINNYQAPYLKVTKGSSNSENLFSEGEQFKVKGLYCEEVIKNKASVEINNAAAIKKWENSIYMENGLIAYLGYPILWPNGEIYGTICIHDNYKRNFNDLIKKQIEFIRDLIEDNLEIIYQNQLNNNFRQYYMELLDLLPVGVMIEDKEGKILKVNKEMLKITGYSREKLLNSSVFETLVPADQKDIARENISKILAGEILMHELPSTNSSGKKRHIRMQERKIMLPNNEAGIISIQTDITDKIISEEKIKYASYHDSLTNLYNRSYLENKIQKLNKSDLLPVAIIMADLNGLKLVNDTYGHAEGDKLLEKMADILKNSCRNDDLVARWGGDEFVIILPASDCSTVEKIVKRINKKIADQYLEFEDGSKLPLSAALGYEVKKHEFEDILDILDEAENKMYKNKLIESKSIKSNILNTLLKTLSEKSQETSFHSNRMAELAEKIAEEINLSQSEINRLNLAAKLHDIGKTVIPERILNKKGKLTESEWREIKDHPAVGHRILNATEEFSHISDAVLSHHEKWDGSGYPRGLKGEEIPLLARIIAIVDAYDVMTNNQIYKDKKSKEKALEEIKNNAGSQFDPELSELFIELMSD